MTAPTTQPILAPVPAAPAAAPAPAPPPASGRTRRALLTWSVGAIYSATTILLGFVTTPILLRLLSAERIGANRAVGEWLGYLLLADLGLGSAFAVLLVRARRTSLEEAAGVAKFALRTMLLVTLALVPAGLVLAWFMPALVRIEADLAGELRWSAVIASFTLLLVPLGIFRTVLETGQRGYRVHAALMAQSLTITGLSLLLAWRGWGLVGLATATLAGAIVFCGVVLWWGVRHLGDAWRAAPVAAVPLRRLWSLSWPLAAAGAGNRLNLMTDAIVVAFVLGAAPVAVLFLTQRLVLLATAQVNALGNATWAALAELLSAGRIDLFEARLAEIARLILGGGLVLGGTLAAYNGHFVRLWVGEPMYGGDLLSLFTLLSAVTFGFVCLCSWVIDTQGDARHRLLVSTIGALLNLVLSIVLVKRLGLAGVALGTLLAYLLADAWFCPLLVCRRYGVRPRAILAAVARAILPALPWLGAAWMIAHAHAPPAGWIGLFLELAVLATLSLAYCWFTILTPRERADWRRRLGATR